MSRVGITTLGPVARRSLPARLLAGVAGAAEAPAAAGAAVVEKAPSLTPSAFWDRFIGFNISCCGQKRDVTRSRKGEGEPSEPGCAG